MTQAIAPPILNSLERTNLRNLEKIIEKGCQTFFEVGAALLEINAQRLYRETHKSFNGYCNEKWGFTGTRARQLMGGAEVAKQVERATNVGISNEAQARPLTTISEEERPAVWAEAVEIADGGSPTMAQVQEAVDAHIPEELPEDDEPINVDSKPADEPEEEAPPAKPDYGKCPVCAGVKWTENVVGHVACAKCQHPHGEPAGDVDEDRINTQRQKTVKTGEALMRAFDDLQTMLAKPEHVEAIKSCKWLIKITKDWK